MTFSVTTSSTFSIIHARYLSSKVAADMHLCAQYYGKPTEARIREYAEELAQYLNAGYLQEYEFGYKKDGKRIVCWRYKVDANGHLTTDDRAGKIVPYVDVTGAVFFNFLTQNSRFFHLSADTSALRGGFASPEDRRPAAFRWRRLLDVRSKLLLWRLRIESPDFSAASS